MDGHVSTVDLDVLHVLLALIYSDRYRVCVVACRAHWLVRAYSLVLVGAWNELQRTVGDASAVQGEAEGGGAGVGSAWPVCHVLVPCKDSIWLVWVLVQQLIVIFDHPAAVRIRVDHERVGTHIGEPRDDRDIRVQLGNSVSRTSFVDVVVQGRQVLHRMTSAGSVCVVLRAPWPLEQMEGTNLCGQHGVDDAVLLEWCAEGLGHVAKVLAWDGNLPTHELAVAFVDELQQQPWVMMCNPFD